MSGFSPCRVSPPDDVEVAAHGPQDALQPNPGGRVALLVGDRGPRDDRGASGRVHPRCGRDLTRLAARELGHPLQRELTDAPTELLEAHRPVAHEVLVVEPLVEDDLEPPEEHRRVAARFERQPDVGPLGILAPAGIEHDELGPPRLPRSDHRVDWRPAVAGRVVPDEDDAVRVVEVPHREPAVGQSIDRRRIAGAEGDAADPVGRADVVHQTAGQTAVSARVPLTGRHRPGLGTVFADDLLQPSADVGHGLVPAHALELTRPTLADPLQRVHESIGVGEALGRIDALHAYVVSEKRVVGCADLDHAPLLLLGHDAASNVAGLTERSSGGRPRPR